MTRADRSRPVLDTPRPNVDRLLVGMFTKIPMLALVAAGPPITAVASPPTRSFHA